MKGGKMKTVILVFLLVCTICVGGCSDDSTSSSSSSYNSVSIRSVNDTLAISISATNHNYSQNIQLAFYVDTLNLYMSVNGFASGNGLFKILRDTSIIFSKDLNSNFSISQQVFYGPPTNAIITLQNYKGNASILLTR
jgi:hypothetical protein